MKNVARVVFSSPGRMWLTILTAILVCMVAMATVLAVKVETALNGANARPTAQASAEPLPEVEVEPSLPTRDQEYLTSAPDAFADLGDPRPVVLAAVDAWVRMDVEAMQVAYLPAALDSVIGTPPAAGFRIDGEPWVETGGPSKAVVLMETTSGLLEIVVVSADSAWKVESIGYRP